MLMLQLPIYYIIKQEISTGMRAMRKKLNTKDLRGSPQIYQEQGGICVTFVDDKANGS